MAVRRWFLILLLFALCVPSASAQWRFSDSRSFAEARLGECDTVTIRLLPPERSARKDSVQLIFESGYFRQIDLIGRAPATGIKDIDSTLVDVRVVFCPTVDTFFTTKVEIVSGVPGDSLEVFSQAYLQDPAGYVFANMDHDTLYYSGDATVDIQNGYPGIARLRLSPGISPAFPAQVRLMGLSAPFNVQSDSVFFLVGETTVKIGFRPTTTGWFEDTLLLISDAPNIPDTTQYLLVGHFNHRVKFFLKFADSANSELGGFNVGMTYDATSQQPDSIALWERQGYSDVRLRAVEDDVVLELLYSDYRSYAFMSLTLLDFDTASLTASRAVAAFELVTPSIYGKETDYQVVLNDVRLTREAEYSIALRADSLYTRDRIEDLKYNITYRNSPPGNSGYSTGYRATNDPHFHVWLGKRTPARIEAYESSTQEAPYPNPCSAFCKVSINGAEEVLLRDMMGRAIPVPMEYRDSKAVLQLQSIPAGVYMIEVVGSKRYKLIRE